MLMNMFSFACFLDENARLTTTSPSPMHLVCTFKTVFAGTTRTCVSTCGRGAGTHGDVLNLHTVGFTNVSHHTHRTLTTTRDTTTTTTTTTTHEDRATDRQKEDRGRRQSKKLQMYLSCLSQI